MIQTCPRSPLQPWAASSGPAVMRRSEDGTATWGRGEPQSDEVGVRRRADGGRRGLRSVVALQRRCCEAVETPAFGSTAIQTSSVQVATYRSASSVW